MKVFFFPPTSPFNPYIDNIVKGLEENGVIIINKKYKSRKMKFLSIFIAYFKGTQIYHFNWIENKSSNDSLKNKLSCNLIFLWMNVLKKSGSKLVWTMHNKESHFCSDSKKYHYEFMKKFISLMDMIVVHALDTKKLLIEHYDFPENKICYVPHGSYITQTEKKQENHKQSSIFTLLSFGMINRYKNIPLLIKAFKDLDLKDAKLVICGKIDSNDVLLKNEIINEIANTQNICVDNRFIPENEVDNIFENCDIVALPYDKQSMINSGAAILAFSKSRPIIVSEFGAIKDIKEKEFVYSYDYEHNDDHFKILKDTIYQVYIEWLEDRESLFRKGCAAYIYAVNDLSWNNICKKINNFYTKTIE